MRRRLVSTVWRSNEVYLDRKTVGGSTAVLRRRSLREAGGAAVRLYEGCHWLVLNIITSSHWAMMYVLTDLFCFPAPSSFFTTYPKTGSFPVMRKSLAYDPAGILPVLYCPLKLLCAAHSSSVVGTVRTNVWEISQPNGLNGLVPPP